MDFKKKILEKIDKSIRTRTMALKGTDEVVVDSPILALEDNFCASRAGYAMQLNCLKSMRSFVERAPSRDILIKEFEAQQDCTVNELLGGYQEHLGDSLSKYDRGPWRKSERIRMIYCSYVQWKYAKVKLFLEILSDVEVI